MPSIPRDMKGPENPIGESWEKRKTAWTQSSQQVLGRGKTQRNKLMDS